MATSGPGALPVLTGHDNHADVTDQKDNYTLCRGRPFA